MLPSSYESKKEKLKDIVLSLHWAATTGNVGLVKFALDHGVPIDSVVNGFVPLQLACINDNNIAVVQYLIDRGANVNIQKWSKKYSVDKSEAVQGATGSTALHVACANGCIKIVDLLLRNHAQVNVKDKYGSTPLDIAIAKNETEIVKLLQSADKPFVKTHKRSQSDKPRTSLPSIDENNHHQPFLHSIHSMMNMTPPERRSFSVHRPSYEDIHIHSCPDTPRSSMDHVVDWYGYGVVNPYNDENYLLSLERRAFNLASDENGQLERRSQEFKRHSRNISTSSMEYDDDDTSSESLPRPSMSDTEYDAKRNWFTGFGKDVTHSVENITRKSLDLRPNRVDEVLDDGDKQQRNGFFSKWAPVWSRK